MRIYVDFDCCLFHLGKFPEVGEPIAGAAEAIRTLKAAGHHITIYSTRANKTINKPETRKKLMDHMESALDRYNIPYDEIAKDKPAWDLLIDDRCIQFRRCFGPATEKMEWDRIVERVDSEFEPLDWSPCDGETDHTFHRKGHGKKTS